MSLPLPQAAYELDSTREGDLPIDEGGLGRTEPTWRSLGISVEHEHLRSKHLPGPVVQMTVLRTVVQETQADLPGERERHSPSCSKSDLQLWILHDGLGRNLGTPCLG